MQRPALLHTTQNHTGHLADLALRELLHHLLHALRTAIGIAVVQHAQALDKEELRAVLTQRKTSLRQMGIAFHFLMAIGLEGFIGGSIQRVLDVYTKALVLSKIRV